MITALPSIAKEFALPIPEVALEDCGAILGRRGAGKSGTGRLLLEHELTAGHRCCVIDPKGDWHGIRMLKDGKPSPFQIPVFGGAQPARIAKSAQPNRDKSANLSIGAERRPLAALAQVYPAGMSEAQWAVAAGLKRSGGTWSTYKSRLRTAGLIEEREGRYFATEEGAASVGGIELPTPPGPDLARWWAGKLQSVGPMVDALIERYPVWVSKEDLAHRVCMAASGGSFSTYLSRLSGAELIERDKSRGIRLSDAIMGEG